MKATAAVLRSGEGPFTQETVWLDEPRADEALIRVVAAGVCHTDNTARAMGARPGMLPMILGHEGAGVVEQAGSDSGVQVGDRVLLSYHSCGRCRLCLAGEPSYCEDLGPLNFTGRRPDGSSGARDEAGEPVQARWFGQSSFATHCLAHRRNIVVVDRDLPLEVLAPLGCGLQTGAGSVLNTFGLRVGGSVAVFGVGAVGLGAVMAARAVSARTIVAVDLHASRRALAKDLGATHTFDGADPDLAARIREAVGDVDAALDTTGVPEIVLTALAVLRPRGQCGMVGVGGRDIVLPAQALGFGRSLTYVLEGSATPQLLLPTLVDLWRAGQFPVERLVRHYPLSEVGAAETDSLSGEVVKPVLLPGTAPDGASAR